MNPNVSHWQSLRTRATVFTLARVPEMGTVLHATNDRRLAVHCKKRVLQLVRCMQSQQWADSGASHFKLVIN